jgi:ribosomal protein S18 acetylase RimI-like enzyme
MASLSQTAGPLSQGVSIRRALPDDAEALAQLGRDTFTATFGHLYPPADLAAFLGEAHGLARVRADLNDPSKAIFLALGDARPLGYALVGPCDLPHPDVAPQDGELKRLYLRGEAQNGGLGAALFDAAMRWLREQRRRTVWIGVWSENHGAQRFYARRGFKEVGTYGFRVGSTIDHELIFRGSSDEFTPDAAIGPGA